MKPGLRNAQSFEITIDEYGLLLEIIDEHRRHVSDAIDAGDSLVERQLCDYRDSVSRVREKIIEKLAAK